MVAHTCNPSTGSPRQADQKLKVNLGHKVSGVLWEMMEILMSIQYMCKICLHIANITLNTVNVYNYFPVVP